MSVELRRSPRLLKRLLLEADACETPKRSSHVFKRQIELTAEERSRERPSKKRREDLVDSVVKAFAADGALSGLPNVAVHEHASDDLQATPEGRLVVVTSKKLHYHEPSGYTSRVRLVLTSTGSYTIQVNVILNSCYYIRL